MFTGLPGPEGSAEKAARASNRPTAVVAGSPSPARISWAPIYVALLYMQSLLRCPESCVLTWTSNGLVCLDTEAHKCKRHVHMWDIVWKASG